MSIKRKILLPMILLTILVSAAILVSNIMLFSSYVEDNLNDSIMVASMSAEDKLASLKKESSVASEHMAKDALIIKALASGDRPALIERASAMQKDVGVEFCTITDNEGNVIARAHEPDKFGDSVMSQANIKSALIGKSLCAIEQGTQVRLSVRSGSPVYDDMGRLIGAVSIGYRLDTETFVDSVKAILNCEVTIFLGDERISTTVIKDDNTRAVGTKAMESVSKTVLGGLSYQGEADILGRSALTRYSPIKDSSNNTIGMLFVGTYLDEKTNTVMSFMRTDLLILLALLAISIPAILAIAKRIVMPINLMVKASHALAAGNTDIMVDVNTKDETRQLADAFNEMIDNSRRQTDIISSIAQGDLTISVSARSTKDYINSALQTMLERNNNVFSQIVASAAQVSTGANQIAQSSQRLAQGAAEQTCAVDELSSIIDNVDTNTTENAAMADKANELGNKIKNYAQEGSEQMEQMVKAVNEINEASHSIGKIIKVIDDIAFQTNILALNAAVEAARAGQYGKGFAVVAQEVRNLAAKSARAAHDTTEIIVDSITKAELGVKIAGETSSSLSQIVSRINQSSQIVDDISKSSQTQRTAISQIYDGINQVSEIVKLNNATAEECAASSEEMSEQARLLQELVSQFKLNSDSKNQ